MSTLDGAVPPGLGITKLRLWDELHRAHCETMQSNNKSDSPTWSGKDDGTDMVERYSQLCTNITGSAVSQDSEGCDTNSNDPSLAWVSAIGSRQENAQIRETSERDLVPAGCRDYDSEQDDYHDHQEHILDWLLSDSCRESSPRRDGDESLTNSLQGPSRGGQLALMPPPATKPGPSRQRPPPLVARIRAKARRAKRKQQKAEYRRRLFLTHLVQGTQRARQARASASTLTIQASKSNPVRPKAKMCRMDEYVAQQALAHFPESAGVDLDNFVEVVFDTDVQSTEVTAPSDVSDKDLAHATRTEIETRKGLQGADVVVPKGVFRWMVARDFAETWPKKVRHVRDNPWPGMEKVWGDPSSRSCIETSRHGTVARTDGGGGEDEPVRWQSGRRSRFIRKKTSGSAQSRSSH